MTHNEGLLIEESKQNSAYIGTTASLDFSGAQTVK